jgi:hypothetical protein
MNFTRMTGKIETSINSSIERDNFIAALNNHKFKHTGHLYAVLVKLFTDDNSKFVAPNGIVWDDQNQDQRDFTTCFASIRKSQDLKKA